MPKLKPILQRHKRVTSLERFSLQMYIIIALHEAIKLFPKDHEEVSHIRE